MKPIKQLIKAWLELKQLINQLEKIGFESDRAFGNMPDLISDTILTLIGFPQNKGNVDVEGNVDDPDYFCRDYLHDVFYDEKDVDSVYKELLSELEKFNKTKKEYGQKEINMLLLALKKAIGIEAFVDSKIERNMAHHCLNLIKKIGKDEFKRRLSILLSDPFHAKNCNKIKYVYNNIKGFKQVNDGVFIS